LISSGTAICGGSAIAAVAPAIDADGGNFRFFGNDFYLKFRRAFCFSAHRTRFEFVAENQFGVWAAIAIHDTSSVVGAAQSYGAEALAIATTVKLARALWIAPIALFLLIYIAEKLRKKTKIAVPYFIFLFLLATVIRTYMPPEVSAEHFRFAGQSSKAGLTVTLFLIGASLSRETLRKVGVRPLVQGILLWIVISAISLWAVWQIL
jgi:uncharacterized membrane protein YadS